MSFHHMARDVLTITRAKSTGVLAVRAEDTACDLFFSDGVLVNAEGGVLSETLGRLLLSDRVISEAQYALVIGKMKDETAEKQARRFGEVAIAMRFVEPEVVDDYLSKQVRRKFVQCFGWQDPQWHFAADPARVAQVASYPTRTPPLLLEAVRDNVDAALVEAAVAPMADRPIALLADANVLASAFRLPPHEKWLLEHAAGRTLTELLQLGGGAPGEVRTFIGAMRLLAVIGPSTTPMTPTVAVPTAAPRRPEPQLGEDARVRMRQSSGYLPMTTPLAARGEPAPSSALASLEALRLRARQMRSSQAIQAVRPLTSSSQSMPRVQPPSSSSQSMPQAQGRTSSTQSMQRVQVPGGSAPSRSGRSSAILREVPSDPAMIPITAENAFQAGKRHLANGTYPAATREFELANACMPDAIEYALYLAWARFQGGTGDTDALKNMLERTSLRMLKQDPNIAFAHYVQAYLFKLAGDDVRATKAFNMAAKLDPTNLDAVRNARILAQRKE